ncbi:MAG: amidohydrolase family protein [Mesonia sp.]|uniref:amidohydrolase family protein n=1 Tax=Mesonia sp. TaxID=1960830 RepID=UPI003F9C0A7C
MIKIVTISPEYPEAVSFATSAVATGVKVAIGHTAATSEQIDHVVTAGASLSTHLGNGSHATLPRHHNYIWDQLSDHRLCATVIADGHHLPNNLLNVFQKIKRRKMMIVSDSVTLAGMPAGDYQTEVGGYVTLTDTGILHLKGNPKIFAGSAQHMLHGINCLVNRKICTLSEAIEKASILPSAFMGLGEKKGMKVGALADIVVMNRSDEGLCVVETYKKGIQVYKRTL